MQNIWQYTKNTNYYCTTDLITHACLFHMYTVMHIKCDVDWNSSIFPETNKERLIYVYRSTFSFLRYQLQSIQVFFLVLILRSCGGWSGFSFFRQTRADFLQSIGNLLGWHLTSEYMTFVYFCQWISSHVCKVTVKDIRWQGLYQTWLIYINQFQTQLETKFIPLQS